MRKETDMIPSALSFWLWPFELYAQVLGKNELLQQQLKHNALLLTDVGQRFRSLFSF